MKKYQSYKPSGVEWIGEIPSGWISSKLKFLLKRIVTGGTPDTSNDNYWSDDNGGYNWISISDMTSNPNGIEDTKKKITFSGFESKRLELLPIDTIIYSIYGSIGKVNRLKIESTIHQGILGLFPNSRIESKYLEFYLKYIQYFVNVLSSSNTQENLNLDKVKNIGIVIPPLHEQSQIVQFLNSKTELIDKLISTKERKITLLKEQRTSLINQVVTKGLNPSVKMEDSGVEWIGEIPEGWIKSKLKYKSKIIGRIGYRGYTVEDLVEEGQGVITLSPSNIVDGELNLEKRTFLSFEKYYESPEIILEHNDIVYVQRGSTIGKSTIIPLNHPEMTINPQLVILKKFDCVPRFIYYFMKSEVIGIQTSNQISGGSTPLITQNSVENFIIVLPKTKQEQTLIVEYLDSKTKKIDDLVQLEQKKIDLLKEYRQSLISEVVTGKIKVTE